MKNLQQFCAVVFMTAALSLSAFAGDIQAPGVTSPPPQQTSVIGDISMPGATVTGDISFPGASVTGDILTPGVTSLDPVTEAALSLFQSILSLF